MLCLALRTQPTDLSLSSQEDSFYFLEWWVSEQCRSGFGLTWNTITGFFSPWTYSSTSTELTSLGLIAFVSYFKHLVVCLRLFVSSFFPPSRSFPHSLQPSFTSSSSSVPWPMLHFQGLERSHECDKQKCTQCGCGSEECCPLRCCLVAWSCGVACCIHIRVGGLEIVCHCIAVGTGTGYGLDTWGVRIRVPVREEFPLLHIIQTGSMGLSSLIFNGHWGLFPPGVKRLGRKAYHLPQLVTKSIHPVPHTASRRSVLLFKCKGNFSFLPWM
jgi:hypothetical protein